MEEGLIEVVVKKCLRSGLEGEWKSPRSQVKKEFNRRKMNSTNSMVKDEQKSLGN